MRVMTLTVLNSTFVLDSPNGMQWSGRRYLLVVTFSAFMVSKLETLNLTSATFL